MSDAPSPRRADGAATIDIRPIARWKHRVSIPLGQLISSMELIREEGTDNEVSRMDTPLLAMEEQSKRVVGELHQLLNRRHAGLVQADADATARVLLAAVDTLTESCQKCVELAQAGGSDALRADLFELSETLVRLRYAVSSLNGQESRRRVGPGMLVGAEFETATMNPFPVSGGHAGAKLLLVDDDRINLKVIGRRLERMGFAVVAADCGLTALEKLQQSEIDLIMLDIMMPELDGFATLERVKADPRWALLPVIMLTALDDAASTARCLAKGADDYVSKPFDETVLRARIEVALDRKLLRDKERKLMERVRIEKNVSEHLLHSILPQPIANRLREGEEQIVDRVAAATVLFIDIVGFTLFSATHEAEQTVALLNDLFSRFDHLVERHGLEKIKTIGDAYLAVAGVPELVDDHAARGARLALAIQGAMNEFNAAHGIKWSVRTGVNSGPLMAGIIGSRKFAYDLWGDTVNVASRLENHAQPDQIMISGPTAALLGETFVTVALPDIELRNRGRMPVFRLDGEHAS